MKLAPQFVLVDIPDPRDRTFNGNSSLCTTKLGSVFINRVAGWGGSSTIGESETRSLESHSLQGTFPRPRAYAATYSIILARTNDGASRCLFDAFSVVGLLS